MGGGGGGVVILRLLHLKIAKCAPSAIVLEEEGQSYLTAE